MAIPDTGQESTSTGSSTRMWVLGGLAVLGVFVAMVVVAVLMVNSSNGHVGTANRGALPFGTGAASVTWRPVGSTTGAFSQPYSGTIGPLSLQGTAALNITNFSYTYVGTAGGHPYSLSMTIAGGFHVTGTYDGLPVSITVSQAAGGAHISGTIGPHPVSGTVSLGGHGATATFTLTK